MFPRYLFVNLSNLERCSKIRSTRGVSSIVAFGKEPALVPFDVINEIRLRCQDDVLILKEPEFNPGDGVAIIDGPYRGMTGIFDRNTSNRDRVIILLEIMASVAHVKIKREALVKSAEE